jgi:NAD(P)-dependent dehydrogenase (short-subunit alcohol dehydrogenase family)
MVNGNYLEKICGLEGKNAVVTGSASGIGRATAVSLANFGANVVLLDVNFEGAAKVAENIRNDNGKAEAYSVDISNRESLENFFANYTTKYKTLDVFVANAGVNNSESILETTSGEIDRIISIDFIGTLLCIQAAGHIMKHQRSGNITIVTSVNAAAPVYTEGLYCAVKAGLDNAARSLAVELAGSGVRVNCLAPGAIASGMNDLDLDPERMAAFGAAIPLQRVGRPEEIGEVIAAMSSPVFRYMTGSTITVDGGLILRKKLF